MSAPDFSSLFTVLTGRAPFPWQEALYKRFVTDTIAERFPACCDLPTGLGKTSVVAVWLIALALYPDRVPRRLVYVVNRRTVVDQTTDEVARLRANLEALPELGVIRERLARLCAIAVEGSPLAISTLRGQFADNQEWSADPCRPAVITGTVDMIGSRLLFSGYGIGYKIRPQHAGFLGQDVLLVHDESHLEPAFQALLDAVRVEQRRDFPEQRRLKVMQLSATTQNAGGGPGESATGGPVFRLTPADEEHPEVVRRLTSVKMLHLHENADGKKLAEELVALALRHKESQQTVVIFVQSLDLVHKTVEGLKRQQPKQVIALTGTMRGLERDRLAARDPIFRRFLPTPPPTGDAADAGSETSGTVYLVCTSAGEVGVNISADHLVCDLSTYESMAQRLGRVNRFGLRSDTRVDVVYPSVFDAASELDHRRQLTLGLLRQLNGDASPRALGLLPPELRSQAFRPPPRIPEVSDILFDAWSLTTIRGELPGRPPVEPWLHGISNETPQTHVAWREEVEVITPDLTAFYPPEDLLETYPLKPHELLQDSSDRILGELGSLVQRRPSLAEKPVWLVDSQGTVEVITFGSIVDREATPAARQARIKSKTLLLPPQAGGLDPQTGMLDSKSDWADDVADLWGTDGPGGTQLSQRRKRVWDPEHADHPPKDMRTIRVIDLQPTPQDSETESDDTDEGSEERQPPPRRWYWYETPRSAAGQATASARKAVLLQTHTDDVTRNMRSIAAKLAFPEPMQRALILAAQWHDLGKARPHWQRSIGNFGTLVLGKSASRAMDMSMLDDYRHEFGSLLDVRRNAEFCALQDDLKDVVLHLIATHHGRGRPHFPSPEIFDPEVNSTEATAAAQEVPLRFARLHRRYGRWGLAWLESLLRAADQNASARPSQFVEDNV